MNCADRNFAWLKEKKKHCKQIKRRNTDKVMKECTFSPRFFSDRSRERQNSAKNSRMSNDTYISMRDRALHSGYHIVRQKKKFVPVNEDYLYKRRKGKDTYTKYYKTKKKSRLDPNSIYLRILNQKKIGRKKREILYTQTTHDFPTFQGRLFPIQ